MIMVDYKALLKREAKKAFTAIMYNIGILAHKTTVDWFNVRNVICSAADIETLHSCSNNLFRIKEKDIVCYFRPVFPHTDLISCVQEAVAVYFTVMHPEQEMEWGQVKKTLADKRKFRKLLHAGNYSDPYSPAREFYLTKKTAAVGVETPTTLERGSEEWKSFIQNIDHFLKYVINTIAHHNRNKRSGEWEFSNANRQMATEAMARLVGLDYMFPHSEFAVVITPEGEQMRGTLMQNAKGESTEGITSARSQKVCSPALQRELIKLNVLDTITYERDHRPGNYNIIVDESDKASGLSVFDNDAEMTFAPMPASTHSGSGCSKIIRGGRINRPYLDEELANRILLLEKNEVHNCLRPFLNYFQIFMCWKRIVALQKAIKNSLRRNGFLLKPEQWSKATIEEELSGKYGRTYLDAFINNEEYNKAFVEYNNVAPI